MYSFHSIQQTWETGRGKTDTNVSKNKVRNNQPNGIKEQKERKETLPINIYIIYIKIFIRFRAAILKLCARMWTWELRVNEWQMKVKSSRP